MAKRKCFFPSFLEYVVKIPNSKQDNSQGWGNHKMAKKSGTKEYLGVDLIYDKIKVVLDEFFENDTLMPSLKKARRNK